MQPFGARRAFLSSFRPHTVLKKVKKNRVGPELCTHSLIDRKARLVPDTEKKSLEELRNNSEYAENSVDFTELYIKITDQFQDNCRIQVILL